MGKDKLKRFEEMKSLERVFQPSFNDFFNKDYFLKGNWNKEVFINQHPIIVELGCGKGEYTVAMAQKFKEKNFIGVDIKGARIWKGAKESNLKGMLNVAFLRARLEFITSFFNEAEVEEIWLTFPDPQTKRRRIKKRLVSSFFLTCFQRILKNNGIVHLKTDSDILYEYTLKLLMHNKLQVLVETDDLYNSCSHDDLTGIKTFYEMRYLEEGKKIKYLKFQLPSEKTLYEPESGE